MHRSLTAAWVVLGHLIVLHLYTLLGFGEYVVNLPTRADFSPAPALCPAGVEPDTAVFGSGSNIYFRPCVGGSPL